MRLLSRSFYSYTLYILSRSFYHTASSTGFIDTARSVMAEELELRMFSLRPPNARLVQCYMSKQQPTASYLKEPQVVADAVDCVQVRFAGHVGDPTVNQLITEGPQRGKRNAADL